MVTANKVDEIRETVVGWMNSIKHHGALDIDIDSLGSFLTDRTMHSYEGDLIGDTDKFPKNISAVAAFVLSEGVLLVERGSVEEATILAALGYLLINLESNPTLYLNPRMFPANDADAALGSVDIRC